MSEEMNGKSPKSKTIGHVPVTKLSDNAKWKDFLKKAEQAKAANEAHEAAKDAMRDFFRKTLKLPEDTDLEFSSVNGKITITQILERKETRGQSKDLSDLFK